MVFFLYIFYFYLSDSKKLSTDIETPILPSVFMKIAGLFNIESAYDFISEGNCLYSSLQFRPQNILSGRTLHSVEEVGTMEVALAISQI